MLFTCPRCSRTKDFSGIYVPPLGRSYRCPCGLSTVVRPTWVSGGQKTLTSAGEEKEAQTQKPVALPVDKVKERLTASAPVVRAPSAATPTPAAAAEIDRRFPARTWTPDGIVEENQISAAPAPKPPPPPPMPIVAPEPEPPPVRQIVPNAAEFAPDAPTARQIPKSIQRLDELFADEPTVAAAPEEEEDATAPMSAPRRPAPSLGGQHAMGAAALVPEEAIAPAGDTQPRINVLQGDASPPPTEATAPRIPAIQVEITAPPHPMPEVTAPGVPIVPRREKTSDVFSHEELTEAPLQADGGVPMPDTTEQKPAVTKPRTWKRRAGVLLAKAAAVVIAIGLGFGGFEYWSMVRALPTLDSIKNYRPPIVTEVRTKHGTIVGKFYKEERYVTALDDIPLHVRQAFLASEDANFYSHNGIDGKSIARAIIKNLLRGRSAQGGSTITQQVARTFLLTREKTYRRKVSEIILARRLEQELSKDEILHRYMNQIFFGHGAYGVEAASRIHFGKHVGELTIAEAAVLAGLPQAPSRYAPRNNPEAALGRRHYVLGEMLANGFITKAQYEEADKAPLTLATIADPTKTMAAFVTEQIRRELFEDFGSDVVLTQGLQVTATVDTAMQFAAQNAVRNGLGVLDHRIGYRPLDRKAVDIEAEAKALGEKAPVAGEIVSGIVEEQAQERAYVRLPGGARGVVHKGDNLWAYPVVPEAYFKNRKADDLTRVLKKGDYVRVRVMKDEESKSLAELKRQKKPDPKVAKKVEGTVPLALVQNPDVEGSLFSFSIPDGRVLAMVGGSDYSKSEYLRPMQAKRQVGSTFKTFVYAAALSKKSPPGTPKDKQVRFTLATILQDAPVVMKAHEAELGTAGKKRRASDEEQWKPGNSGDKYYGDTPLRTAFILSRNVPTLQLAQKVGVRDIISFARKMGIESELPPDLSLALGSASLTLFELTRAHAAFPAGGMAVDPKFIEKVVDRDGNTVYDLATELAGKEPVRLVDQKTAFVMTQLMLDVARSGTASEVGKHIKKTNGGKTGTTNDYIDAWYVGFTPTVMTGVWVGYDQVKSLGVGETGAEAALPIWIEYMKSATEKYPEGRFVPPEGVVKMKVDRATGKRARPGQKPEEVVETWFVRGTEPTEVAQAGVIRDEPNLFEIDPGLR